MMVAAGTPKGAALATILDEGQVVWPSLLYCRLDMMLNRVHLWQGTQCI